MGNIPEATKDSEIPQELNRLEGAVSRLSGSLEGLEDRIGAVLRQSETKSADEVDRVSPETALGRRIAELESAASSIEDRLRSMHDRLEL